MPDVATNGRDSSWSSAASGRSVVPIPAGVVQLSSKERCMTARCVSPQSSRDLAIIGSLHMELLDYGPMAGLGETFIREAIYRQHLEAGSIAVVLYEVDGIPAGFAAYTDSSMSFHRGVLPRRWLQTGAVLIRALLERPGRIVNLLRALRVVRSRRREVQLPLRADERGEVVCVAVRREFLQAKFVRATGRRPSEDLIRFAAARLREQGMRRMRMLVDADNREVLLLYHLLGARFEPYEQAGEPMVQVWFDLNDPALERPLA